MTGATREKIDFAVTALDAVDPAPEVFCDTLPDSHFEIGKTRVTCIATDSAGNVSDPASFSITVIPQRGDVDADGYVGITDAIAILDHLYKGNKQLNVGQQVVANVNGHNGLTIADSIHLLNFRFIGGTHPASYTPEELAICATYYDFQPVNALNIDQILDEEGIESIIWLPL